MLKCLCKRSSNAWDKMRKMHTVCLVSWTTYMEVHYSFSAFVLLHRLFPNKNLNILFTAMKQDLKYNPPLFAPCHSFCKRTVEVGPHHPEFMSRAPPCPSILDWKQEILWKKNKYLYCNPQGFEGCFRLSSTI